MVGHGHIHLPIIIIRCSIIEEVERAVVFPPLSVQVIAVETAKTVGVVEFTKIVM